MMTEPLDLDKEGMLDHTPLKFGKFKGKTPEQVSEVQPQYLVWAYETVGNFDVCSEALYRECGGKGKRAVNTSRTANPSYYKPENDRYESRASSPARSSGDFDDDIPF